MKTGKFLEDNWLQITIFAIGISSFIFCYGCKPKVSSLLYENTMVTAPELEIELQTLLAIAKIRQEDLVKQNQLRDLILKNVLIIAETGTVNPLGILTALFAFYGIGSAANTTKNAVKKKLIKSD